MWTGVQWNGNIGANATVTWFTWGWPANWHVVWHLMPTTVRNGNPQLDWDVSVERASNSHCTYWVTVKNLTNQAVNFEGRFAVLRQ
jgi:hypothetical protein